MPKVTIDVDETTYTAWQEQAAAQGLSLVDWLKHSNGPVRVNGQSEGRSIEDLTPAERAERMRNFWGTLTGCGGTVSVDRENLYE